MKGSVDLRFLPSAQNDLRKVGRLARPLLSAGIRDQVVLSLGALTAIPAQQVKNVFGGVSPVPESKFKDWYVLPVGSYTAVVHPVVEDGHGATAVVGRIFEGSELSDLIPDLPPKA